MKSRYVSSSSILLPFFSQPKMGFHVAGESDKQKKLGDLRGRREAKQVSPLPLVKAGNDDKQAMKLRIL